MEAGALDIPAGARIVLAHDWLVGLRGGEHVLDRLARLVGPTDLFTLVDDGRSLTDAISACRVVTSPLQKLPAAAGRMRRHYLPLMPWAVGRLKVGPCDLLVSTSSAVMKSIRPPAGVPHLCYCHSPARYLWEQSRDYRVGAGGTLRGLGLGLCGPFLRRWDRRTASRVTRFLANSEHTARRIERCFGRQASVVYPPVRIGYFTPDPAARREDWMLVVAALEPYKRTEQAIDAAAAAGVPLKVVGSGTQEAGLRRRGGRQVEFLGRVDDAALRDLYRRARGLLFPQLEDFGIVAVEAQATGCPVIAVLGHGPEGAGGAAETITSETGVLIQERTPQALADAVAAFDPSAFDPMACRRNAERFGEEVFDAAMLSHVRAMLSGRSD